MHLFCTISRLPRWKWPYINEVHFVLESSPIQVHCFQLLNEYAQVVEHACFIVVLWQTNNKNCMNNISKKAIVTGIVIEWQLFELWQNNILGGGEATTWSTLQSICIIKSS
jgi:hypothetical protein